MDSTDNPITLREILSWTRPLNINKVLVCLLPSLVSVLSMILGLSVCMDLGRKHWYRRWQTYCGRHASSTLYNSPSPVLRPNAPLNRYLGNYLSTAFKFQTTFSTHLRDLHRSWTLKTERCGCGNEMLAWQSTAIIQKTSTVASAGSRN